MSKSSARVLKLKGFWLALLAAAALLALVGWLAAKPAQSAQHAVSVESATAAPLGTASVDVTIVAPANGLTGWSIDIGYDSTLVTATGCTTSVGADADVEVCETDVGGTGDTVRFIGASTGGVTGTVTIGSITFDALAMEGMAALTVSVTQLLDGATPAADVTAGVTTNDGIIDVTGETATPTPTPTPVPPTATPPPPFPFGDVNCDTVVDPIDALQILLFSAELETAQADGCPPIGPQ